MLDQNCILQQRCHKHALWSEKHLERALKAKWKMTNQIIFAEAVHPTEIIQQTANAFCHSMLFSPQLSHSVWVVGYLFPS